MLKGNKYIAFKVLLLTILFSAGLGKVNYLEVYSEIYEDGKFISKYTLIFQNNKEEKEIRIYPENMGKIKIVSEICKIEENCILCTIPEGEKIEVNFKLEGKIKKINEKNVFEENLRISESVENLVFVVKLPEGAVLPKNGTKFMPSSGIVGSDGRRILVAWEKSNLEVGEIYGVKVFFEFLKGRKKFNIFYSVLLISIALFGGIVGYYFFYYKRKAFREVVIPLLREDEKRIMEIILKYPKGVHQKIIVKESNYSKAKVSKVLKSLAKRGMVKLERRGRNNIVYPVTNPEKQ